MFARCFCKGRLPHVLGYLLLGRSFWLLVALSSLQGCACILLPTPEHGLVTGHGEIAEAETASLEISRTTREEVLLRFGEPSASLDDGRILLFYWSTVRAYVVAVLSDYYVGPIPKEYILTLEFDDNGRLKYYERSVLRLFEATGTQFSDDYLKIPEGKSAIFVYRPKSFVGSALDIPITVDTQHLADLQNGGFAEAIVGPGWHDVLWPSRKSAEQSIQFPLETMSIHLDAGEKVFVRVTPKFGLSEFVINSTIIPEKDALPEISKTRRSMIVVP